ncbi:MAG: hypothetical protein IRZ14_07090 [Chloroflexi bacterium]|nr:hypothetical protein [Chloroflexota bacterium]
MADGRGRPLTDELVREIAEGLVARWEPAPFRVHGAPVYRLTLAPDGKPPVQLTLWPSLARADVLAGDCAVVFKGISSVLIFPLQEVVFQRAHPRGFLLVSREGRVATAS